MRVDDSTRLQIAVEGVLVRSAGVVGNFYATGLPSGIVVYIEIRGFIESVQERAHSWGAEVVVNISEAMSQRLSALIVF